MKFRKIVAVSILIMLGIACVGALSAIYTDYSVKASALSLPDALNNIPSDYQFVFGLNVTNLAQYPVIIFNNAHCNSWTAGRRRIVQHKVSARRFPQPGKAGNDRDKIFVFIPLIEIKCKPFLLTGSITRDFAGLQNRPAVLKEINN